MNDSRGSIWRKWDLHIHSNASRGDSTSIPEEIVNKLIENGVSVFSITDHNSVKNVDSIRKIVNEKRASNVEIYFLPGVELKTDKGKKSVHITAIFPEKDIQDHLINGIYLEEQLLNPLGITKVNLIDKGKELLGEHDPSKMDDEDLCYEKGLYAKTVNFEEASTKIREIGGVVIVHAGTKGSGIEKEMSHKNEETLKPLDILRSLGSEKMKLMKDFIDICELPPFSSNNNQSRRFYLKKFHKPSIVSSDDHDLARIGNAYTWIKADPTFEGLKQIIYEPKERVEIQGDFPEPNKSIYTLSQIQFSNSKINDELELQTEPIVINKNLIAVIGGKGAGKTALLDLIANCFQSRLFDGEKIKDKNSFVQRVQQDYGDSKKPQADEITTKIDFLNSEDFEKSLTLEQFFTESKIEYLPQGRIEELSSNRKDIHNKIMNIISESEKNIDEKKDYHEIGEQIEQTMKKIRDFNNSICNLEQETTNAIIESIRTTKSLKEGELKDKETEIEQAGLTIDEDIKSRSTEIDENRKKLEEDLANLIAIRDSIENLIEKASFFEEFNRNITEINTKLKSAEIDANIALIIFDSNKLALIITYIETKISTKNEELNQITEQLKNFGKYVKLLRQKHIIEQEINEFEKKLIEINEKKKRIKELEGKRKSQFVEMFKKLKEQKEKYESMIDKFSEGKEEILSDIDFKASIFFDGDKFKKGSNYFDGRIIKDDDYFAPLMLFLESIINENVDISKKVAEYIAKANEALSAFKTGITNQTFYSWLYDNYCRMDSEIIFDNKNLEKLSIGQKGTILLKLLLAEGDCPLIVDQPEENLDNRFVYGSLVDAFKKAKKNRQIIIATHNANLVVNADAEQIIVADYKEGKIKYKSGSIENPDIKGEIIELLEGSKEAFEKREDKYGFRKK